jgi:serine/threonine-protein kinase
VNASCPTCLATFRTRFDRCPTDGTALVVGRDPLIGTVLAGRYLIEAQLGQGGLGRVYRARHVRMSRRFAVKVLFGEVAADPSLRARFASEAEAAGRLSHPNVAAVVDVGESDAGLVYLAMELADGPALSSLHDRGPLPVDRALALLAQIADGLAHAHERGLVHRDLKPCNIVLDGDRLRIVDFGIALVRDGSAGPRLTACGMVVGTLEYMAPEQALGEPVDHRVDLYALGVIAYEMLAGTAPFSGGPFEIVQQHITMDAPALHLDPEIDALVASLLAKDPVARPPSARSVSEQIARLRARRPAALPPPAPRISAVTARFVKTRFVQRRRGRRLTAVVALALAAIVLLLGVVHGRATLATAHAARSPLQGERPAR